MTNPTQKRLNDLFTGRVCARKVHRLHHVNYARIAMSDGNQPACVSFAEMMRELRRA